MGFQSIKSYTYVCTYVLGLHPVARKLLLISRPAEGRRLCRVVVVQARLKSHIHDPNSPELVHFLFTPLSLIVEAARDPKLPTDLPSSVVAPLLTAAAVALLRNCLTSKEMEFWTKLGHAWTTSRSVHSLLSVLATSAFLNTVALNCRPPGGRGARCNCQGATREKERRGGKEREGMDHTPTTCNSWIRHCSLVCIVLNVKIGNSP